jgi:diguanylate cyclase (GGDEF)-like protein
METGPAPQSSPDTTEATIQAFERLLDQLPDPAWICDTKTLRFLKVNAALSSLTEYSRDDLVRMKLSDLFQGNEWRGSGKEMITLRGRTGRKIELETISPPGGSCRLVVARVRTVEKPTGMTERRRLEAASGTLQDSAGLMAALGKSFKRMRESPDRRFALLIIGVDRFRLLNQNLGPEGAAHLLVAVAKRLESLLQSDETLAPLENARFAILLEGVANAEAALHMVQEIQGELEAPFPVSGQEIGVTASVGVALGGPDVSEPADLLKNAEYALHDAKTQGIGGHRVFNPEMRVREAKDRRMEMDLRPGIERGDLRAYFQPIVAVRTGALAGFEALARWHHPELGVLMPAQFIPMAESTGIIVDLGKQMMVDACRRVCEWQSRFRRNPPLFVTVNCSAAQLSDSKLSTLVRWALVNSGLAPQSLKLELTESVLMEDTPETRGALDRIVDLGVQLMIDDFGTGYSSLSRLHQLPIEALKIDRSFVSGLVEDPDSQTMVRAIIQMARNFDMKVTAEGVETPEQLKILRRLDCDFAQGYYFSKPVEPDLAEKLISSKPAW